jgi:hypothetical protein
VVSQRFPVQLAAAVLVVRFNSCACMCHAVSPAFLSDLEQQPGLVLVLAARTCPAVHRHVISGFAREMVGVGTDTGK